MVFDYLAFVDQQVASNSALLAELEVPKLSSVRLVSESPSPVKPRTPKKPKVKPTPPATPSTPPTNKELVEDREKRGLRSSGRVKNQLLGLTPRKEERYVPSMVDDDDEEGGYWEGDKFVRTEGGSAPKSIGVRRHDPKKYGSIPGVQVNDVCMSRMEWSTLAVHGPPVSGIAIGNKGACVSLCTAGGSIYGDADHGERFTYSGSGGRDLGGTKDAPKNLRTAAQTSNMTWDHPPNAALLQSVKTGLPIRVLRGFKGEGPYAPKEGYIYSGLYQAVKSWIDKNADGLDVCRIALVRLPGQPPLSIHPDRQHMVKSPAGASRSESSSESMSRTTSGASASTAVTSPEPIAKTPTSRKRSASAAASPATPSKRRQTPRKA
ncbi:hypothetical protein Rhopal_004536-T1 [Rhodotorula paludigena]|uniref:YDG domain-containing protein n=1 Tax=Rhodotorula paludigena TaxID=86838 RepID=A0AAV5GMT6_9BASI|nr:hypothetical protein Rhopal_004536-T1 [Rhodotorula paludigena]